MPGSVESWDEEEVIKWLGTIAASFESQYGPLFKSNNISGKRLVKLTEEKLERLGISSLGHREDIIEAIQSLVSNGGVFKFPPQSSASPIGSASLPGTPSPFANSISSSSSSSSSSSFGQPTSPKVSNPPLPPAAPPSSETLSAEIVKLVTEAKQQNANGVLQRTATVVKLVKILVPEPTETLTHLLMQLVSDAKAVAASNCTVLHDIQKMVETAKAILQAASDCVLKISNKSTPVVAVTQSTTHTPALKAMPLIKSPTFDTSTLVALNALNTLVQSAKANETSIEETLNLAAKAASVSKKMLDEVDHSGRNIPEALGLSLSLKSALANMLQSAKSLTATADRHGIEDSSRQILISSGIAYSRLIKELVASYADMFSDSMFPCGKCGNRITSDAVICSGEKNSCDRWFHRSCVGLTPGSFECLEWLCNLSPCSAFSEKKERERLKREEEKLRILKLRRKEDEERAARKREEEERWAQKRREEEEERKRIEEEKRLKEEEKKRKQREAELAAEEEIKRQSEDPFERKKRELDEELGLCTVGDATVSDEPKGDGALFALNSKSVTTTGAASSASSTSSVLAKLINLSSSSSSADSGLSSKLSSNPKRKTLPPPKDRPVICKAKAIYDYDVVGGTESDLFFKKNDILNIYSKGADSWWEGEINGIFGTFPASFVEEILDTPIKSTLKSDDPTQKDKPTSNSTPLPLSTPKTSATIKPAPLDLKKGIQVEDSASATPLSASLSALSASSLSSSSSPNTPKTPSHPASPARSNEKANISKVSSKDKDKRTSTTKIKFTKNMISTPRENTFEHISHVGWNATEKKFEVDNVPEQWKAAIQGPEPVISPNTNPTSEPSPGSKSRNAPPPSPSRRPTVLRPIAPVQRQHSSSSSLPESPSQMPESPSQISSPSVRPPSPVVPSDIPSSPPAAPPSLPNLEPIPVSSASSFSSTSPSQSLPPLASTPSPMPESSESGVVLTSDSSKENISADIDSSKSKVHLKQSVEDRSSETEKQAKQTSSSGLSKQIPEDIRIVAASAEKKLFRAKYTYAPKREDELELKSGDQIRVLQIGSDGWYTGISLRSGRRGLFPGNYVEEIPK